MNRRSPEYRAARRIVERQNEAIRAVAASQGWKFSEDAAEKERYIGVVAGIIADEFGREETVTIRHEPPSPYDLNAVADRLRKIQQR